MQPVTSTHPEPHTATPPPTAASKKPALPSDWAAKGSDSPRTETPPPQSQNGAAQSAQFAELQRDFDALKVRSAAQSSEADKQTSQIAELQNEIASLKTHSTALSAQVADLKATFARDTHELQAQIAKLTDLVRSQHSGRPVPESAAGSSADADLLGGFGGAAEPQAEVDLLGDEANA